VSADRERVCLGVITGARGLRGDLWLRSFTADPAAIAAYGALTDAGSTRHFDLSVLDVHPDRIVARVRGVDDRAAAEALKGTELYVARAALPPPAEDEYYHADLIGLAAFLAAEDPGDAPTAAGRVAAVHDFGGGPVIEIGGGEAGSLMVPFTRDAVPVVDLASGRLVIARLPGLLVAQDDAAPDEDAAVVGAAAAVTGDGR
jgi:16S rRNA processing protein RimM